MGDEANFVPDEITVLSRHAAPHIGANRIYGSRDTDNAASEISGISVPVRKPSPTPCPILTAFD
jgi:hypothetical protein